MMKAYVGGEVWLYKMKFKIKRNIKWERKKNVQYNTRYR